MTKYCYLRSSHFKINSEEVLSVGLTLNIILWPTVVLLLYNTNPSVYIVEEVFALSNILKYFTQSEDVFFLVSTFPTIIILDCLSGFFILKSTLIVYGTYFWHNLKFSTIFISRQDSDFSRRMIKT